MIRKSFFKFYQERRKIMFNMQKIGRKISVLRKKENMTQMELADRMGISFQAVSNWERGNSMPDISKLPELAEIFRVPVDELLGEKSALVEAAINDNIEECIINQNASAEDVSAVLPILKPAQVNTIVANANKLDWKGIQECLPFMNEDDVKEFAQQAMEQGKKIEVFLPFMSEDDVKGFAQQAMEQGKRIEVFLPFMSEGDVKKFAQQAMEQGKKIEVFLPFMSEDDVKEFAQQAMEQGKKIEIFLPFMSEDDVKKFAMQALEQGKKIEVFLPFMSEDDVKELCKRMARS